MVEARAVKLDFVKSTKRNVAAVAFNRVLNMAFPFLNRTLFLWLLGPEYLGLNGLFRSVLGVLSLAELGFGMAIDCSMYKAVAEDDHPLICAYMKFYRAVYRCVGSAIFGIGLCMLPFLGKLVHGDVPPDVDLHVLFLIHLANTSLGYFLFAYRRSILGVYNRKDVLAHIATSVSTAQYVAVFLVLLLTRNYYYYVATTVAFTALGNLLIYWQSRRLFPNVVPGGQLSAAHRRRVVSDVKSIFMHKVGSAVSFTFDNVVVSAFLGLVAVAAYGNYYYVYTAVAGLVGILGYSMMSGFGNKIHTESRDDNFRLFMKANRLVTIIVAWCAAMMTALYQPFIEVWTKGDPKLVRHFLTPVLMVTFFYVSQSRLVLQTFKSAAAIWKEDRWKPIVSAAANLAMNLSFVLFLPDEYKLDGVILSTILAFVLIEIPCESDVLFTVFFDKAQSRQYWKSQAVFLAAALALCAIAWCTADLVALGGFVGLFAKGAAAAFASGCAVLVLFRHDVGALRDVLRKGRRRA